MSQRLLANAASRARATQGACAQVSRRALAALVAAATTLACAFAQAPEASGIERLIAQDAARLLDHDAPEVRGEAALVVAASGDVRHEARLLELALEVLHGGRRREQAPVSYTHLTLPTICSV